MTLTAPPPLSPGSQVCSPRWATPRTDRPTYGGKVAEIAEKIGKPLMPWQRQVADVALEYDPHTMRPAYREVIVHVMRQQGKTTLQLPIITHRCIGFGTSQQATYAAQSGVAARQKLLDEHWPLLSASELGRLCKPRRQSGHEAIEWRNGSRHGITTGTEKAGHGLTLDLAVIDEAFAYADSRLEQAFVPAMQTKPNAQLWIMSTAGNAKSVFLRDKVSMGRRRVDSGSTDLVAYFEWSFTEDEDPYDPATWWGRMPALGYTTGEREIAAAAASMDEREFLRAFGNRWLDDEDSASPIGRDQWLSLVDDGSAPFGQVSVGIEVAQDRSWSSVMAVGPRGDGLLDCTLLANREGTSWVIDFVRSLLDPENRPVAVVIDPSSPAGSFVQELAKITDMPLVLVMARDMTQACGSL